MEIKILTNYDDNLWCVGCKKRINFLERFGVIYDCDSLGVFKLTYHLDCIPECYDETEEPYISE